MNLTLHIDNYGRPYLELDADSCDITKNSEDELLEFFISEARKKGIVIVNEGAFDASDYFATIRIKGDEK